MRGAILAGVVVALVAAMPATAFGARGVEPWDGTNPFRCEIQYAGEGTTFQHPDADPFCVDYDKTHQDISELGLVKFLQKEPARVAAAEPKCWYYQQDHWTGQIIAGDGSTETYHFDGAYFFDKRLGNGGVHVDHFTINHQTADPSELPGFPPGWKPYFGPGRGGVVILGAVNTDRNCLPRPGCGPPPYPGPYKGCGQSPYVNPGSYNGGGRARRACRKLGGAAHRGLGRARLGLSRARIVRALGRPVGRGHGFLRFCARAGGSVVVHFGRNRRADFVVSNARSFHAGKARVGWRLRAARAALRRERVLGRNGANVVLGVSHRGWRLLVGARRGRVTFLAAAASSLSLKRLGGLLIGARG